MLTIYSAAAGQKATDFGDGNSLFTGVLVRELTTPGLGLRELAFRTQGEVARLASLRDSTQEPEVLSRIIGEDVYLTGRPAPSAAVGGAAPDAGAQQADFAAAMKTGTVEALRAFETKYGSGPLVEIARQERERIGKIASKPQEVRKPIVAAIMPDETPIGIPSKPITQNGSAAARNSRSELEDRLGRVQGKWGRADELGLEMLQRFSANSKKSDANIVSEIKKLCDQNWPKTRQSGIFIEIKNFIDGDCAKTKFSAEAQQISKKIQNSSVGKSESAVSLLPPSPVDRISVDLGNYSNTSAGVGEAARKQSRAPLLKYPSAFPGKNNINNYDINNK